MMVMEVTYGKSKNAKAVYEEARKRCKKPVIFQVPTKEEKMGILCS